MIRTLPAVLAIAAIGLLPASALAAKPATWSGKVGNPGGQKVTGISAQTVQLRISGNKVSAGELKLVMVCTDSSSGAVRRAAFAVSSTERAPLIRNRFALNFIARSGGWHVLVNLSGRLGSNGDGTAQVQVTASGVTEGFDTVAEHCGASAKWRVKRAHSS